MAASKRKCDNVVKLIASILQFLNERFLKAIHIYLSKQTPESKWLRYYIKPSNGISPGWLNNEEEEEEVKETFCCNVSAI